MNPYPSPTPYNGVGTLSSTNGASFPDVFAALNSLETDVLYAGSAKTLQSSSLTPAASVPGPLPLMGAAAAFGWSRRLRRRVGSSTGRPGA